MLIKMIDGHTRVCGKSQGYIGLPVRDEIVTDAATGNQCNMMHSAWEPTPDELEILNAGGVVLVSVIGNSPQPIMLTAVK